MGGARTSPVHTYRNTVNFLIRGSCWETKAVDGSAFCVCVCVCLRLSALGLCPEGFVEVYMLGID